MVVPTEESVPLGIDEFCRRLAQELGTFNGEGLDLDAHLVDDLGFDSLQLLQTIDFIESLLGDGTLDDESEIIEALSTVRTAYGYYLTHASMPVTHSAASLDALGGRLVRLRAVGPVDYPRLYQAAVSNEVAWRWRYGGGLPSYEDFLRTFSNGVLTQLAVTSANSDSAIGLVVAYSASLANRTVYLAAMIEHESVGAGQGGEATMLFVRHLFRTWDFEKVYLEVPEYNMEQFASGVNTLFSTEACLKSHLYGAGRRWDQYTLAIYRDVFQRHWPLSIGRGD